MKKLISLVLATGILAVCGVGAYADGDGFEQEEQTSAVQAQEDTRIQEEIRISIQERIEKVKIDLSNVLDLDRDLLDKGVNRFGRKLGQWYRLAYSQFDNIDRYAKAIEEKWPMIAKDKDCIAQVEEQVTSLESEMAAFKKMVIESFNKK